jgi:tetratricopeptide (TPR) repeat protein
LKQRRRIPFALVIIAMRAGWSRDSPRALSLLLLLLLVAASTSSGGGSTSTSSTSTSQLAQPELLAADVDCPRATVAAAVDVWALRDAAAALEGAGKTAEAAGCRLRAVADYPGEGVAHFDAGRLWQERGQLEKASTAYERALALDPAFSHAANNLGAVYKQLGRYARAEQVLTEAIALDGQFAGLEYNLGMLLVKTHSERRALGHLQAAMQKAKPPEPPPRWHDDLAAVLEALHRIPEALEQSTIAVALEPTNARFARRLSRLRGDGGAVAEGGERSRLRADVAAVAELEASGEAGEAYEAYERLAAAHPDDDDLLYRLAWNRFQQKDYYPAHTHLSAALALAPTNRDYLTFMGVLMHETGNWDEAADYLNDAIAMSQSLHRSSDEQGAASAGPTGEGTEFENEEYEVRSRQRQQRFRR